LYNYDAFGNALDFDPSTAKTEFLYSGEQFDSKIGQQYLRQRYYDPTTGRFNRLDPFFGNLNDPLSLHKYLYTHGDPVNGIDPSGLFSIGGTLSSMAIGALNMGCVGGTIGAVLGLVNGSVGWFNGQMTIGAALWSVPTFALRGMLFGMVTGGIFGPMVVLGLAQGWYIPAIVFGTTSGYWGINYALGISSDEILSALPFQPLGSTPYGWVNVMQDEIREQAIRFNLPPELIASVILYEMNQYNIFDWMDEEVFSSSYHSMGIVQMRVDNVKDWVPSAYELTDSEIRDLLLNPEQSIALLAEAMGYWRDTRSVYNYGVSQSSWHSLSQTKKELLVQFYCSAKDLHTPGSLNTASKTFGVTYGLNILQSTKLFDE
jgi:RHS repeat-associated protein